MLRACDSRHAARKPSYPWRVIEKLIASLMARQSFSRVAREEFDRLQAGGYLNHSELEKLAKDLQTKLGDQAESARGALQPLVQPLVAGIGQSLREALDIPSRSEILELTRALRAARGGASAAQGGASAASPAVDPQGSGSDESAEADPAPSA